MAHVAAQCLAMKVGTVFGHESWLDQRVWYLSARVSAGMYLRTQDTDKTRPVCAGMCLRTQDTARPE